MSRMHDLLCWTNLDPAAVRMTNAGALEEKAARVLDARRTLAFDFAIELRIRKMVRQNHRMMPILPMRSEILAAPAQPKRRECANNARSSLSSSGYVR
jgi:hypothetical protein